MGKYSIQDSLWAYAMGAPLTANDLTNIILHGFPQRYPGSRLWRQNTGSGFPPHVVASAKRHLAAGNYKGAMAVLSTRMLSFGISGEGDLSGWHSPSGRRVAIEVKVGKDKQSEAQIAMQDAMRRGGAVYVVARTPEQAWSDLEALLLRPNAP